MKTGEIVVVNPHISVPTGLREHQARGTIFEIVKTYRYGPGNLTMDLSYVVQAERRITIGWWAQWFNYFDRDTRHVGVKVWLH